jgi:hypothetical protein
MGVKMKRMKNSLFNVVPVIIVTALLLVIVGSMISFNAKAELMNIGAGAGVTYDLKKLSSGDQFTISWIITDYTSSDTITVTVHCDGVQTDTYEINSGTGDKTFSATSDGTYSLSLKNGNWIDPIQVDFSVKYGTKSSGSSCFGAMAVILIVLLSIGVLYIIKRK